MFPNFSAKARQVIMYARLEAGAYGAAAIESEHLLLGLVRADMNLINRFYSNRAALSSLFKAIETSTVKREQIAPNIELPLSAESQKILDFAAAEAEQLASKQVGSEHVLLALLHEEDSLAARILRESGFDYSLVRLNTIGGENYA